jgi:hypothetical protein
MKMSLGTILLIILAFAEQSPGHDTGVDRHRAWRWTTRRSATSFPGF